MKEYDVVIIGGATAGSYFARNLALNGIKVLVIDAKSRDKVGTKYDIFHISRPDFATFDLPMPVEGEDYAFSFESTHVCSALGNYPKFSPGPVIGMHMHEYTLRLNDWAMDADAEFLYGAAFKDFTWNNNKISGIEYELDGKTEQIKAKLVADCSGIPSVARRKLPDGYGVENFEIKPDEMFYVVLRYIRFLNPEDKLELRSWPFYKTWEAPEHDPTGAILGIGANLSYNVCEKVYKEFEAAVELPPYEVKYFERGSTPYRRPPYSFVADSFITLGDSACITKPSCGEGVTAAMVQMKIAVDVVSSLLKEGKELSRKNMWSINKIYNDEQGEGFANQMAVLIGAVASNAEENDFFFANDLIFSTKNFIAMNEGGIPNFSIGEILEMAKGFLKGIFTGKLRISSLVKMLKAIINGAMISGHYKNYPETVDGFDEWCKKADKIWIKCGKMADFVSED